MIILIIFFAIIWALIIRVVFNINDLDKKAQEEATNRVINQRQCPPHRWGYETDMRTQETIHICKLCRGRPGQLGTDYDKPY